MNRSKSEMPDVIARAVARSDAIGKILIAPHALQQFAGLFKQFHGRSPALLIADENTYPAAGKTAEACLQQAGVKVHKHILPGSPRPKPTVELGDQLAKTIADTGAAPIAVGSGVINDLVKYAAFRQDAAYSCIATAASMDGYSSAGAPLSDKGFKITIQCRPPVSILADLDVIAKAPAAMAGWGYGDMAGKMAAGGDWLIADALGIEPIDSVAWPLVQDNLNDWLSSPDKVAQGDPEALSDLFAGLTVVGLAMEFHGSSRPASGADHQIAHLWEMENLTFQGETVAHGACVSIGTLTVLGLFDWLLQNGISKDNVDTAIQHAESLDDKHRQISAIFGDSQIGVRAFAETRAKHVEGEELHKRLLSLLHIWPELRARLKQQLISRSEMEDMLRRAGAPVRSVDIGVSPAHHRSTTLAARYLRSRYTVLDTLAELGLLDRAVDDVFNRIYRGRGCS